MDSLPPQPAIRLFAPTPDIELVDCLKAPPLRTMELRLLSYLAISNSPVSREWLSEQLWPDSEFGKSRANLRALLRDLRKKLGASVDRLIVPTATTIELTNVWVDVREFARLIKKGDDKSLKEAVELYRGPLLAELSDERIREEREHYRLQCLVALEELASHANASHRWNDAIVYLRRALVIDPLRESTARELMKILEESGDTASAIKVFDRVAGQIRREIECEPSVETIQLAERIRGGRSATLAYVSSNPGATPAPMPRFSNVPHPTTRLVGRSRELADLRIALTESRLVTIVGTGGVGKTRLAIDLANQKVREEAHGSCFVELGNIDDPRLVAQTLAESMGLREATGHSVFDVLINHLRPLQVLVTLDTCEHLLPTCRTLSHELLRHCPHLRILTTSQEPLRTDGEIVFPLSPLPCPGPEDVLHLAPNQLLEYGAIELFYWRARAADRSFALTRWNAPAIARLCRYYDGLPLAIELVTPYLRMLSPEQIVAEIADLIGTPQASLPGSPPRHRDLIAVLDWSHRRLSSVEKALFHRLSVFAGGWTLDAAQAVCGDVAITDREITIALAGLVDKSLVTVIDPDSFDQEKRYRLLEIVQRYALLRLAEDPAGDLVHQRHFNWYSELALRATPRANDSSYNDWFGRLGTEHYNLRTALRWAEDTGNTRVALATANNLYWYWKTQGHWTEGYTQLKRLLEYPEAVTRDALRAEALGHCAQFAQKLSHYNEAEKLLMESLSIWQELGCVGGVATTEGFLGGVYRELGKFEQAATCHRRSLTAHACQGNERNQAIALHDLGVALAEAGNLSDARGSFEESLDRFRNLDDRSSVAMTLLNLGELTSAEGDHERSLSLFAESLSLGEQLGDQYLVATNETFIGSLLSRQVVTPASYARLRRGLIIRQRLGDLAGLADSILRIAEVSARAQLYETSARLLASAIIIHESSRQAMGSTFSTAREMLTAELEAALSADELFVLFGEGKALCLNDAVTTALSLEERLFESKTQRAA